MVKQRVLSMLIVISTLLSLFISPAYAWDASAGGDGDFGEVGSGNWSENQQGIRITILAPDGQPV